MAAPHWANKKSKIKNYILKKKIQDQQEAEQEVPIEDENI